MTGVIDAYVHLWDRATDPQPWIDPQTMAAIDRDFAPADLERMLDDTGGDTAVVVQAGNSIAETRRLLAGPGPRTAAVVGWIDLTGVRFVLDHLGGGWETGLRALAAQPNVHAKISGLAGLVTDPSRLRRMVGVAVEAFGPHRLMYGSDWPLACLSAGPVVWRTAVDQLIGELSAGERTAILSGTAATCYRLGT
jgi:predicted TIM-barrel fold metal-dependent hydrolase